MTEIGDEIVKFLLKYGAEFIGRPSCRVAMRSELRKSRR